MEGKQKRIRETVERAWAMTEVDLEWKPYYPNNMLQNGQEGWYCVLQNGSHARRYTILFQYPMDEEGYIHSEQGVDRWILFEKLYHDLDGPLVYPEPFPCDPWPEASAADELNDFGQFHYACRSLEQAKGQALRCCQMVFGYALSHLLEDEEEETQ